ncbi:CG11286 [Drosophila busckii]|uniref:CG11286 n=2 Tax=Drosophila busckii TaxID=30019 RepID=A0A0M4EHC5_DROBS|nr:CG11286 [Drosophila busckii]
MFEQSIRQQKYFTTVAYDLEDWVLIDRIYKDSADVSEQPSYSTKKFSYELECHWRYLQMKSLYDAQFMRQLKYFISTKPVSEQYFTKRLLSYTTLWPPLHTKRELEYFKRNFFKLTPAREKRLEYLLKTDLSMDC